MRVVFDVETDGFLDEATRVHCLVIRDVQSGELLASCTDDSDDFDSIEKGLEILSQADRLYGHNIIGFDLPVLQKIYPDWSYTGEVIDTLVVSRFRYAHMNELDWKQNRIPKQYRGLHSLASWGHRLKLFKGDYKGGFESWNPEMHAYCEQDVILNLAIIEHFKKVGGCPPQVVRAEMELAFYLVQQERNGWPFDIRKAGELQATLAAHREELSQQLKDTFGWWYASNGVTNPKRNNSKRGVIAGCPYTKLKQVDFNPASRQHIALCLTRRYNWKPTEFTPSGKPKVDESTLKGLDYPEAKLLRQYLLLDKRLGQLAEGRQAWMKRMDAKRPEGGALTGMFHIHHSVSQTAVTHRHRHSRPNLGQVPATGKPYGRECRELFTTPKGWVHLGADASGLELRCLSHYMARWDDGAYGEIILNGDKDQGTDIHTQNQQAAQLATRDQAKTFIYAYLYGAGDAKLGSIVDPTASEQKQKRIGKKLRAQFEKGLPAMGYLVEAVKAKARKDGKMKALDGRWVYVRHEHAALNTLLQSAGAIICKHWIVNFDRTLTERFGPQGWNGEWVALGWIHDEVQLAVRPNIAVAVADVLVKEIEAVTDLFSFRIPLTGEAQIGASWAETH